VGQELVEPPCLPGLVAGDQDPAPRGDPGDDPLRQGGEHAFPLGGDLQLQVGVLLGREADQRPPLPRDLQAGDQQAAPARQKGGETRGVQEQLARLAGEGVAQLGAGYRVGKVGREALAPLLEGGRV
jgi:hypothetical protein